MDVVTMAPNPRMARIAAHKLVRSGRHIPALAKALETILREFGAPATCTIKGAHAACSREFRELKVIRLPKPIPAWMLWMSVEIKDKNARAEITGGGCAPNSCLPYYYVIWGEM